LISKYLYNSFLSAQSLAYWYNEAIRIGLKEMLYCYYYSFEFEIKLKLL